MPLASQPPSQRAGWTAATRCRQHGQRRRLLSLYEGQTIEFSVRNQNSGPPRFVIQSDGTNRIAEVFSCQPAKPHGKEKDRADSEIHKHANPRVRPTCDAKKNRADHYDRR